MQKYAIVTGGTKGIGKQIAQDLLAQDCYVIINYQSDDHTADKIRDEFIKISPKFDLIKADLSTYDGANRLVDRVKCLATKLDYIIYNAGMTSRTSFPDLVMDDWDKVFNTNLSVPYYILQRIDNMLNINGRIIFIGSILGRVPHAVSIPYGVSKSALETLVKYLAPIFSPRSITVNVLTPGFTDTGWHANKDVKQIERIKNKICLKRFAFVAEISNACMFLLQNDYVTGQTIVIDGGYSL